MARERLRLQRRRHDVLGQLDVRGAGLLGLRDLKRLAYDLRDDRGVGDARVPLGDRPHEVQHVDVLVRLLVHPLEVALARQRHQRRSVEEGVGDSGDQVGGAGPERPEADARTAGETAIRVRHVRTALLVADRDELDLRTRQRLVEVEGLLARYPEDMADALSLEALDEDLGGFARTGHAVTATPSARIVSTEVVSSRR